MTPSTGRRATVNVNGLFLTQRITGQQRYASEVARQLTRDRCVRVLEAPPRVKGSAVLTHLWAQTGLPVLASRGALLSMTSRSPVLARRHLLVVHDLFPLTHPEWYSRRYAITHGAQLYAQLRTATALAAVSQPVVQQLRERFPRKQVLLAPNAPSDVFCGGPVSSAADQQPDTGFFLAVGSMDPRKNFARLVRAYAALPSESRARHPLCIVGGKGGNFSAIGVDLGDRSGNVRALGYLGDVELSDLYRRATAVVVPSLDEGFGLPVVEALAAGAVVVASDIPVFRWVAGDRALFFDPLSESSITQALADSIQRPATLNERQAGRDAVRERFSWDSTAAILLSGVRSLL